MPLTPSVLGVVTGVKPARIYFSKSLSSLSSPTNAILPLSGLINLLCPVFVGSTSKTEGIPNPLGFLLTEAPLNAALANNALKS